MSTSNVDLPEDGLRATSRCLACGSEELSTHTESAWDAEYFSSDQRFRYLACKPCGSLSIDPVPEGQLSRIYPGNYYSYAAAKSGLVSRVKKRLDHRLFAKALRSIDGDKLRVLDIGGGAGNQLDGLKEAHPRIAETWVVDFDQDAEELAKQKGHHFFCGRIEDYDGSEPFDLILALNLIEHVAQPELVLRKCRDLLPEGGRLLIKTPNHDSLDARLFRDSNWAGYHCPRHWVLFERGGFDAMCERAGLKVDRFRYTQGAPFWTNSVLFALAKRGWIRGDADHPVPTHGLKAPLNALFACFDFARGLFMKTSQMIYTLSRAR